MKILITGGTNGMGKGVAKTLASRENGKHELIILCRSEERGKNLIKEIEMTTHNTKTSIILCDLSKLRNVKKAIEEIYNKHDFLDAIFINAGIGYAAERIETIDGMDSHFQVNYLSQFMLILNVLNLLEKSNRGGRVIFNATKGGEIFWQDMQMQNKWNFEDAIHQAMVAKRMFLVKLHKLYLEKKVSNISFVGFHIPKAVWTNQIKIIPTYMRIMARIMKFFGRFYSMEECGQIMAPLFTEDQEDSLKKSGKFITWKKGNYKEIKEDIHVLNPELQDKLWNHSLELCSDKKTVQISETLHK